MSNPWLGNGTFSYANLNPDYIQEAGTGNDWVGNLLLLTAHDTGVVGLLILCMMVWMILRTGWVAQHTSNDRDMHSQAMALYAAFCCLFVAYQATSAFSLGFTWILVSLVSLNAEFSPQKSGSALKAGTHGR